MNYRQALKLYPIAKSLIEQAQADAPNYLPASNINRCATCVHFERGTDCELYDFVADADYVCDSWGERNPDVGELRALIERAGARHSRGDNDMLQTIHDMSVELGAVCQAELAKKKALLVYRHLGGKHNQKTHANRFGSRKQIKESLRRLKDDKRAREKLKDTARRKLGRDTKQKPPKTESKTETVKESQKRVEEAEKKFKKVSEELRQHRDDAPFQGEISGGEVQPGVIRDWQQSRHGKAWDRKDDKLTEEFKKAQDKLEKEKQRLTIAQQGGKTKVDLDDALDRIVNMHPRLQKEPSHKVGSLSMYRKRYNKAKKTGIDMSGYPTPTEMKKQLGL